MSTPSKNPYTPGMMLVLFFILGPIFSLFAGFLGRVYFFLFNIGWWSWNLWIH